MRETAGELTLHRPLAERAQELLDLRLPHLEVGDPGFEFGDLLVHIGEPGRKLEIALDQRLDVLIEQRAMVGSVLG